MSTTIETTEGHYVTVAVGPAPDRVVLEMVVRRWALRVVLTPHEVQRLIGELTARLLVEGRERP